MGTRYLAEYASQGIERAFAASFTASADLGAHVSVVRPVAAAFTATADFLVVFTRTGGFVIDFSALATLAALLSVERTLASALEADANFIAPFRTAFARRRRGIIPGGG